MLTITMNMILNLDNLSESLGFYALAAVYLIAIVFAYTVTYWFLGERLFTWANLWINTAILVGPALLLGWWGKL